MVVFNNIQDLLAKIQKQYDTLEAENQRLRNELFNYSKEEEVKKAKEHADYIADHALLLMSDDELAAAAEFKKKHYEECVLKTKISTTWIYKLSGTGIGTVIEITCPYCKKSEDVTDISHW